MLDHLRRLSSQTLIYGLGDAVTRIAGLLLLPIYTRFLSPDDYGKLALITLFSTVVADSVAPDGTLYEDVVNVTAFAREHGVYPCALCRLGSLKQKKHKGWRLAI